MAAPACLSQAQDVGRGPGHRSGPEQAAVAPWWPVPIGVSSSCQGCSSGLVLLEKWYFPPLPLRQVLLSKVASEGRTKGHSSRGGVARHLDRGLPALRWMMEVWTAVVNRRSHSNAPQQCALPSPPSRQLGAASPRDSIFPQRRDASAPPPFPTRPPPFPLAPGNLQRRV